MLLTDAKNTGGVDRSGSARMVGVLALAALAPLLVVVGPESRWDQPALAIALAGIVLVNLLGTVAIKPTALLDAEFVAVLLACAFLGPLPAAGIWISAEIAYVLLDCHRPEAHLANVASYGWAALAGAIVLNDSFMSTAGAFDYLLLGGAAMAMLCVNFAVTRGIVAVLLDRRPLRATIREELIRPAPATLLMVAVGVATAFLYTIVGLLALALFTAIVLVPQTLLPILSRPRPIAEVEQSRAVSLYALTIARALKLSRSQRLVLQDASTFLSEGGLEPVRGELSCAGTGHCLDVQETVLYCGEHWDGSDGFPGAVGGEMIPLTSRVLAVAAAWARLTAAGSPELTHSQALTQLESRAGLHFDPRVVAAAARIVETEKLGLSADTAYQPRLRQVRLPSLGARLGAFAGETA